jgi:hypothetical protein
MVILVGAILNSIGAIVILVSAILNHGRCETAQGASGMSSWTNECRVRSTKNQTRTTKDHHRTDQDHQSTDQQSGLQGEDRTRTKMLA